MIHSTTLDGVEDNSLEEVEDSSLDEVEDIEDNSRDEPGTPNPSKTPRATVKNPIYGLIEGVRRGNVIISK